MMNPYNKNNKSISSTILSVFKKISVIDGKTRNYGTDQPLYDAEVHLIKVIKENEGIHITALAERLNVTKGAVSQVIMKLQKKGMVVKEPDSSNQSRILLKLTEKGQIAYVNHEALHKNFDDMVQGILQNESDKNKEFLSKFLSDLNNKLIDFEE